jgi:hypothetical protein
MTENCCEANTSAPWVSTASENLVELRTDANELRGCGATVQQIAPALRISPAYALRLLERRSDA